jgi:hypothetical protein
VVANNNSEKKENILWQENQSTTWSFFLTSPENIIKTSSYSVKEQQQRQPRGEKGNHLSTSTATIYNNRTIHSLDLLSSDSVDPDYHIGNASVSSVDHSDTTPLIMDFLVGPGSVNATAIGNSISSSDTVQDIQLHSQPVVVAVSLANATFL